MGHPSFLKELLHNGSFSEPGRMPPSLQATASRKRQNFTFVLVAFACKVESNEG